MMPAKKYCDVTGLEVTGLEEAGLGPALNRGHFGFYMAPPCSSFDHHCHPTFAGALHMSEDIDAI